MEQLNQLNEGIYYIKNEDFENFLVDICASNCSVYILNINHNLKKTMCYAKYNNTVANC